MYPTTLLKYLSRMTRQVYRLYQIAICLPHLPLQLHHLNPLPRQSYQFDVEVLGTDNHLIAMASGLDYPNAY